MIVRLVFIYLLIYFFERTPVPDDVGVNVKSRTFVRALCLQSMVEKRVTGNEE